MSQREYAKHRGVSHVSVQRAIKKGRLVHSVRDGVIIDPALADREWAANTDYTKAPASVIDGLAPRSEGAGAAAAGIPELEGGTVGEASAADKYWKAKLSELKFREAAGELVPAKDVAASVSDAYASARTRLLAVPAAARQRLSALTLQDTLVLEELIREALSDLSGEEP